MVKPKKSLHIPFHWFWFNAWSMPFLQKSVSGPSDKFIYFYQIILVMQFQGVSRDTTPQKYYMMSATTYLTAMVSSNRALQYVNYPTQVIGKSCKPIPVMVLGALYAKKKYPIKKYCFILTIVAGVVLFVMKDTSSKVQEETSWFGYFLLVSWNL